VDENYVHENLIEYVLLFPFPLELQPCSRLRALNVNMFIIFLETGFRIKISYVYIVGFEVLKSVVMKISIFWAVTPCSLLKNQPTFQKNVSSEVN
jgi:hypothetical protein